MSLAVTFNYIRSLYEVCITYSFWILVALISKFYQGLFSKTWQDWSK